MSAVVELKKSRKGKNAQPEVTVALEDITPAKAKVMLERNDKNRNIRRARIEQYARDMLEGRWHLLHEPVGIDYNEDLINGQHRLFAVILANKTVRMIVMRNLPPEAQDVADQGLKRNFKDMLTLRYQTPNATTVAAAVRQLYIYRATGGEAMGNTGGANWARNPTISELTQTYLDEPELIDSMPYVNLLLKSGVRVASGVAMALHYLFREVNREDADEFFERLASGEELKRLDPIFQLRKLFLGNSRPRSATMQAACIIKAFNYWREGRQVQYIAWRGGGANPEPFPKIEKYGKES